MLGKKEGFPRDIAVNHKNDAHVISIVARCGRNLNENMVELDESSQEKSNDEQAIVKRKWLEEKCVESLKYRETVIVEAMIVEEKGDNKGSPQMIDGDEKKVNEP